MKSKRLLIQSWEVLARLNWEENDDLEFKSARGGLPKSLWETYVAMANTHGGVILLGVENDGSISGVENIQARRQDFWNTIHNRGKVNINLLKNEDVQELSNSDRTILAIRVPRASRLQKPIFIDQNPLTGTYRRNAEGDYLCTEQEVSRMLADRAEEPADSRMLEHYSMNDLDIQSFQQYRQRLASLKPDHPWLGEDDKNLLIKLGGYRINRSDQKQAITVAGLLMFGKQEALREALPQYHVDYREKLSNDPHVRWTDRLVFDGTWPGNLFQFYLRVVQRLAADLKLPFQLENDFTRKGETVVHIAIREALVNALIHADYQGQGGVVIEKYQDRFEFSNPGTLLISIDQLLQGNISECRNKTLQNLFTMIGAAEKAGSGVDKIRFGWNSQHWRSPIVREQVQPDRVFWILPMVSLIPNESLNRLKHGFGRKFLNFNKHEIQALVTADIERFIDNARMRQITNLHAADITLILQGLVSKEALIQKGQGRWTRYTLPTNFHSEQTLSSSVHMGESSVHMGESSVHMANNSVHIEPKLAYQGDITDGQWEYLLEIARPARENRHIDPQKMEEIILNLCKDEWLTRTQLSALLSRNADSLRTRFLTQMVRHQLLKLRYSDKPNRMDQAYKTV